MASMEWPWQYSFPPFFTIQLHNETRTKQIAAWRNLVLDYHRITKQHILDIREAQRTPLFNNTTIDRKLPLEGIVMILDDLARTGNAEPLDKQKHRWHIYWHTLEEWADLVYSWVQSCGMANAVCTIYEITEGDNTIDEEFHGLDNEVMIKVLQTLGASKKAELFDDNQGVKFF
ncbi:vacuolar protein-sorting-associated protein 25 [Cryptotermes secundus]|uniref:vacuolar protein-sorting-associated protein 25 n=1 Tax=Cryptotermes secundus TaxID=105785 RepID=UPI000CD7D9D0|nr:vacuolar protein-sorting-associated protein 25 [Cryptotermes secundus]